MARHSPHGGGSIPLRCRECGRGRAEVEYMSKRALCGDCGDARGNAARRQLAEGAGPFYDEWRAGMLGFLADLASE